MKFVYRKNIWYIAINWSFVVYSQNNKHLQSKQKVFWMVKIDQLRDFLKKNHFLFAWITILPKKIYPSLLIHSHKWGKICLIRWYEIYCGVLQSSIIDPLLFVIYIDNLATTTCLWSHKFKTPFICAETKVSLNQANDTSQITDIKSIETSSRNVENTEKRYSANELKANLEKMKILMLFTKTTGQSFVIIFLFPANF